MKLLVVSLLAVIYLSPLAASAQDSSRVHVYLHDANQGSIHHTGPASPSVNPPSPCFPFGCGEISGPFRNPDPHAREPQNLTACIYGVQGTLLYEREGKVCAYKYEDQNKVRVERRRQENAQAR